MPEGPEILYSSVIINKLINSFSFNKIEFKTDKYHDKKNDRSELNYRNKFKNIHNYIVSDVSCKGKLLWIKLKNKKDYMFIHIHYGLHGWMFDTEPDNYLDYIITFNKKENDKTIQKQLFMQDKINLNKIYVVNEDEHNEIINKMGIDIFSDKFTKEIFKEKIQSKRSLLAGFMLSQDIFCGMGNYIKNDGMYMTKLNVRVKTCDLDLDQINELYHNILFIAYSKLLTHKRNIMKYLPEFKKVNKPNHLEVPYEYKVYSRKVTDDGQKVIKVNVSGRASYSTQEYTTPIIKDDKDTKDKKNTKKNNKIKVTGPDDELNNVVEDTKKITKKKPTINTIKKKATPKIAKTIKTKKTNSITKKSVSKTKKINK